MKVPFYILGLLLRFGPQHGYRLMQMMEERISDFAHINLSTIYYHLQKLDEQAYITKSIDKDGNRPEKYIYTITEAGIAHYNVLYSKLLDESYHPEFSLDGVLFYSDRADTQVLLEKLSRKKEDLAQRLQNIQMHKEIALQHVDAQGKICAELIFDHHIVHLEAEYEWLKKAIEGLSS